MQKRERDLISSSLPPLSYRHLYSTVLHSFPLLSSSLPGWLLSSRHYRDVRVLEEKGKGREEKGAGVLKYQDSFKWLSCVHLRSKQVWSRPQNSVTLPLFPHYEPPL